MGRAVVFGVGFAVPVTALAYVARERVGSLIQVDDATIVAATDLTRAHPALLRVLVLWQEALRPIWVYLAGTGVCLWAWKRHGLRTRALWGFVTMMVAWNIALDLKYVVQRARPVVADPVSHAPGYSFPSGHAANSAAATTVVILLVWPLLGRTSRYAVLAGGVLVVAATAADRVLLGVHYPSDVVAGVLVGSGLALASYLGYLGWSPGDLSADPPGGKTR